MNKYDVHAYIKCILAEWFDETDSVSKINFDLWRLFEQRSDGNRPVIEEKSSAGNQRETVQCFHCVVFFLVTETLATRDIAILSRKGRFGSVTYRQARGQNAANRSLSLSNSLSLLSP